MLIAITETRGNERGPLYMEKVLDVLHQSNPGRQNITLEYACRNGTVGLYCRFPSELNTAVWTQMSAAYPDSTITPLPDDALASRSIHHTWTAELRVRRDIFPIRRHPEYVDSDREVLDPVSTLLAAIPAGRDANVRASVQIRVAPCRASRCRSAKRIIQRLSNPFFRNHPVCSDLYARAATSRWLAVRMASVLYGVMINRSRPASDEHDDMSPTTHNRETSIEAAKDKVGRYLFETEIVISVTAPLDASPIVKRTLRELAGTFGAFSAPRLASFHRVRAHRRWFLARRRCLLSSEELATLWHPPTATARAERMEHTEYRTLEPPIGLPNPQTDQGVTVLGRTDFRRDRHLFGLNVDDRRRHVFICGKTGMGKSTLLASMIQSDIEHGRGVGLIDPHGDLAEQVIARIPSHRTNDVVYFDAGDRDFPIAFNPVAAHWPEQRQLVAAGILAVFRKQFNIDEGTAPRLLHILRNSVHALLETPGTSLLHLQRLLQDGNYRRTVTGTLSDPVVRAFWLDEFAQWNDRYRTESIAPVLNKLGAFSTDPILRNIIGQSQSKVHLRSIMDGGKILIVNLSKGRVGEDTSGFLGSVLVNMIQVDAMTRADIPENERRDFFLYVDEFQNFATESFATILSEARKFRLSLTIANQFLSQLQEKDGSHRIRDAVFGNVGSMLAFQVGADDAEILSEQIGGVATPDDLMALPKYRAYIRPLVDGVNKRIFSMQTIAPAVRANGDRLSVVRRVPRRRYARRREQAEAEIMGTFAFRNHSTASRTTTAKRGG